MNRFITGMIALAVILCFITCLTVYADEQVASDYVTPQTFGEPDEAPAEDDGSGSGLDMLPDERLPLDNDTKLQMAQEYAAQYGTAGDPAQFTVLCFKTLSNGMTLAFVESNEWCYNDAIAMEPMGEYVYIHGAGKTVKLYQNGVYTEFFDAYLDGVIDDDLLDEIDAVMHFDRKVDPTQATEGGTPADETTVEETVPAASPTEPAGEKATTLATRDTAVTARSGGVSDSGVISTGGSALIIAAAAAGAIALVIWLIAARKRAR